MPSILSKTATIKKSSPEDFSLKWEDNKDKSLKTGPVLEVFKDNSEDHISRLVKSQVNTGAKNLKGRKPNKKLNPKPNQNKRSKQLK
jgi:hypothetical protein